ncbi:MAG: threonylcarbamoyl-AMP synthase [Acidobacteria bacterium]|nr:threonylcarbamoyl-AMP synthase [Acidobacteriota bacterium]
MTPALETLLTTDLHEAARFIQRGELVAFPTETVYGLGADVFNESAIGKVFAAKGRPSDNPLIAHVSHQDQIKQLAADIPDDAQKMIDAFFPAPLTLVLPKHDRVPLLASAGLQTIGVRMPRHDLAREFITACGTPLVAPSANLSGSPSPTTWQAVAADLLGRIACILQGVQTEVGLESTVVDCTGDAPVVLRTGGVTLEQLQAIVPATRKADATDLHQPKSPGLKYRHYAPHATVVMVSEMNELKGNEHAAWIGLHAPRSSDWHLIKQCADVAEYAHELFAFFRACDAQGIKAIYCEAVAEQDLGVALMDRIRRAAHR